MLTTLVGLGCLFLGVMTTYTLMSKEKCEHKWEDTGNRQYPTCVDFYQKCTKCGNRRTIEG